LTQFDILPAEMNRIAGFNKMGPLPIVGKQQQLSCKSSYVKHCQILTPADFLLWGFLKESFYSHNPKKLEDLKT